MSLSSYIHARHPGVETEAAVSHLNSPNKKFKERKRNLAVVRLLEKHNSFDRRTHILSVVGYDISRGVGLKVVSIPKTLGKVRKYAIHPIPVLAGDSRVYDYVLDVLYPDCLLSDEGMATKCTAKMLMEFLIHSDHVKCGPMMTVDEVAKIIEQSPL